MNEIQAQVNGAIKAPAHTKPLSSAPQVDQSKKDLMTDQTKAEKAEAVNGNSLPTTSAAAEVEGKEVAEAVSKLNAYVQKTQRHLDFQLDEESGRTVVRVYDTQSDELVRQIPDEAALELAKRLNSEEPSLLFSAQV